MDDEPIPSPILEHALESAKWYILDLRYPFGDCTEEEAKLTPQLQALQVDMAVEIIARLGAEGQIAHAENGISRNYASAVISPELRARVIPVARGV